MGDSAKPFKFVRKFDGAGWCSQPLFLATVSSAVYSGLFLPGYV
jgi:hypothetical protein